MLRTARTLIVDEIHALVRDKRGSHLALSVERLEGLVAERLVRIGLSATQRPIEQVASFLVGAGAGCNAGCVKPHRGIARCAGIGGSKSEGGNMPGPGRPSKGRALGRP